MQPTQLIGMMVNMVYCLDHDNGSKNCHNQTQLRHGSADSSSLRHNR